MTGEPRAANALAELAKPFAAILALALSGFILLYKLGVATWHLDELIYSNAGSAYVKGNFAANDVHPFLGKYLIGLGQLVFGRTPFGARLPAVAAAFLTGALIFLLVRRVTGFWPALVAFGLWFLLPHAPRGLEKMERLALLEVFMAAGMTAALYCGWRWGESRKWSWALAATISIGLATACKITGLLIAPVVLAAPLFWRPADRHYVRQLLAAGGLVIGLAFLAFVVTKRTPIDIVQIMVRNMGRPHPVSIGGQIYTHPPPWTHLYFQWETLGTVATAAAGLATASIFMARRRLESLQLRFAGYAGLALLVPLLWLSLASNLKLPHYIYVWQPALAILIALGLARLVSSGSIGKVVAVALSLPLLWLGAVTVSDVAATRLSGYGAAGRYLEEIGLDDGHIYVLGYRALAQEYLPEAEVNTFYAPDILVVIVDERVARRFAAIDLARFLRVAESTFDERRIDELRVFIRS